MKLETAKKLLEENRRIYDEVASNFSQTRAGKLQELKPLIQFVKDGDRVLDVGSGSGRLLEALGSRDIEFHGIDSSAQMIKICQEKFGVLPRVHFEVADLLAARFPDNYFDLIYALATVHHIPSRKLRLQALQELHRLLKPDGKLIMTNWYWWRLPAILLIFKFWFKKILYIIIYYSHILKNMRIVGHSSPNSPNLQHSNILQNVRMFADLDLGDIFVPWGKAGSRYYHSFRKTELKKLLGRAGFVIISQYLQSKHGNHWGKRVNLITIAEKFIP